MVERPDGHACDKTVEIEYCRVSKRETHCKADSCHDCNQAKFGLL